ncbi:hypothetical protein [Salinibaculum rarum]|uniref:hypothetical protein n=1 Tax=Salinibaculum rarum TaxID=3058903 RepID=UPI00265E6A3A|nr:hypothetical protein [Salinibaculum sp. KK48]
MNVALLVIVLGSFALTAFFAKKTYRYTREYLPFWFSNVERIIDVTPGLQLVRGTTHRDESVVTSPITGEDCLAYEIEIRDATGTVVDLLSDSTPFFVLDGTGSTYVHPEGADFIPNSLADTGTHQETEIPHAVTETTGELTDDMVDVADGVEFVERRVECEGYVSVFGVAVPWQSESVTTPVLDDPDSNPSVSNDEIVVLQDDDSPFLVANAAQPLLGAMVQRTVLAGAVTAAAAILTLQFGFHRLLATLMRTHAPSFSGVSQADVGLIVGVGSVVALMMVVAVYQYYCTSIAPWTWLSSQEVVLMWAPVFGLVALAYFVGQLPLGGIAVIPVFIVFVVGVYVAVWLLRAMNQQIGEVSDAYPRQ